MKFSTDTDLDIEENELFSNEVESDIFLNAEEMVILTTIIALAVKETEPCATDIESDILLTAKSTIILATLNSLAVEETEPCKTEVESDVLLTAKETVILTTIIALAVEENEPCNETEVMLLETAFAVKETEPCANKVESDILLTAKATIILAALNDLAGEETEACTDIEVEILPRESALAAKEAEPCVTEAESDFLNAEETVILTTIIALAAKEAEPCATEVESDVLLNAEETAILTTIIALAIEETVACNETEVESDVLLNAEETVILTTKIALAVEENERCNETEVMLLETAFAVKETELCATEIESDILLTAKATIILATLNDLAVDETEASTDTDVEILPRKSALAAKEAEPCVTEVESDFLLNAEETVILTTTIALAAKEAKPCATEVESDFLLNAEETVILTTIIALAVEENEACSESEVLPTESTFAVKETFYAPVIDVESEDNSLTFDVLVISNVEPVNQSKLKCKANPQKETLLQSFGSILTFVLHFISIIPLIIIDLVFFKYIIIWQYSLN
jgi:hypothetical protein